MKKMKTAKNSIPVILPMAVVVLLLTACMKDFLDIKRDKTQVIPVTLEDYRSVFENQAMNYNYPVMGEIGSDDYYITAQQWNALSDPVQRNAYIWADDVYQGGTGMDWNRSYERVLYANFVLEGVSEIAETPANKVLRDEVIGAAHFFRGINFFLLAQLFCRQYDPTTAAGDLGIPLRTTSNINVQFQRASLADTYDQIIDDLKQAARLLPPVMSLNTRPYKAAALGMLANVYLQMGDYPTALGYADNALSLASDIIDYSEIDASLSLPFPQYGRENKEIVFFAMMNNASILANARLTVDSVLYNSYDIHDLRGQAFFFDNAGRITFKGHYSGSNTFYFTGLTSPEFLLVRAECNAWLGNLTASVKDLNRLLSNRFEPQFFEPVSEDITQSQLLRLVLSERRKELIYRGRRWHDLKRFGDEPAFAKSLVRVLDGTKYTLPSTSPRWVWPLPPDVVNLGGLKQNDR